MTDSTPSSSARVIVCGSGLAGLAAGVSALEAGARITLIEKAPSLGGSILDTKQFEAELNTGALA